MQKKGGEMNIKNTGKKATIVAMIAVAMLIGAIGGSTVLSAVTANAQSATITPAVSNTKPDNGTSNEAQSGRTLKPNEDTAHEAKESPEREAQENAGKFPTVK